MQTLDTLPKRHSTIILCLTKHLVPPYDKADKPTSALEYLKNYLESKLEKEFEDIRKNVTHKIDDKMDEESGTKVDEKSATESVEQKEADIKIP